MEPSVPSSQLSETDNVTDVPVFLDDQVCSEMDILNQTGKTINVTQYDNDVPGSTYPCPTNSTYHIEGIINANQIKVSNGTDTSAVTVQYRYYN